MDKFSNERVQGFLRANGRKVVNESGEEIILRGWAAANWTNPEGFMIGAGIDHVPLGDKLILPGRFERARSMDATIRELCGSKYAEEFWPRWYRNHLAESDIRAMQELGYNSVRLPVTAWAFLREGPGYEWKEDSFKMLNDVLDWCEKYRIYAILDLHGAPGGQSAIGCDDGIDNVPHMFLEPESRERTMVIWEEFARRYGNRWIVGGYDLLNEPLSSAQWLHLIPELQDFYKKVIKRIRRIDKKHMLILEGAIFSTDMRVFEERYDEEYNNWCISVHMYGFTPHARDLYKFLDVSERLNIPVWIGEGNADDKSKAVFFEIAADYGIGYNLFGWKASEMTGGQMGGNLYKLPKRWNEVAAFIRKGEARPGYLQSAGIFDEMLEAVKFENCIPDQAAFRYSQRSQGISLPAVGYDNTGGRGISFYSKSFYGNPLGYRSEDGMKLVMKPGAYVTCSIPHMGFEGVQNNPLEELWLEMQAEEFACYTIRNITCDCYAACRMIPLEDSIVRFICEENVTEKQVEKSEKEILTDIMCLSPGRMKTIKVQVISGRVIFIELNFPI